MQFRNVLLVAAHPDDETLGAGGTIPLVKKAGGSVTVLIVTDGSSAQHGNDIEARARRDSQLVRACEILGVDHIERLSFPDMRLDTVAHIELNMALTSVMEQSSFDTVLCHHHGDVNMDHRRIFESVVTATRPTPGHPTKQVLTYFVNSATEWGAVLPKEMFCPNVFIDISETIDTKIEALQAYVDELRPFPHPRSIEAVRARATTIGSEVGLASAEAFQLLRYKGTV